MSDRDFDMDAMNGAKIVEKYLNCQWLFEIDNFMQVKQVGLTDEHPLLKFVCLALRNHKKITVPEKRNHITCGLPSKQKLKWITRVNLSVNNYIINVLKLHIPPNKIILLKRQKLHSLKTILTIDQYIKYLSNMYNILCDI